MRNQERDQQIWESSDLLDWPDDDPEIDDEEFARAIAEGRREEIAA